MNETRAAASTAPVRGSPHVAGRNGTSPGLSRLHHDGAEAFRRLGWPTPRWEDWKYTDLSPVAGTNWTAATPNLVDRVSRADLDRAGVPSLDAHELVLVAGHPAPALTRGPALPSGVRWTGLAQALNASPELVEPFLGQVAHGDNDPLVARNASQALDGAFLHVPGGLLLERPLHLIHVQPRTVNPLEASPRVLAVLGARSQATLVQTFVGGHGTPAFTNAVTEAVVGDDAIFHHYAIQRQSETTHHIHTVEARLGRNAVFADHNVAVGGAIVRNTVGVSFTGEGGDATLNGLYLPKGKQHMDNHSRIDHAVPHCTSREFYKGILDGEASGVFYGKVLIQKGAMKTNASQTNKNLVLSDKALVNSTPALEIFADDVKASHGSTTGQLDKDQLYYLRARGIDATTARSILTYAFARDVLGQIPLAAVRDHLDELLINRLPNGEAVREALAS